MAVAQSTPVFAPPSPPRQAPPQRLIYIDAFRGFTMVCMFSVGFGLRLFKNDPIAAPIAAQFEHTNWQGMTGWDLIQPFFMFIVGVVMPVAFQKRWAAGETWATSLKHVLRRCALLLLWGLIARSIQAGKPTIDVINVLGQLSFTYLVAFLVLKRGWKTQGAVALGLLALDWALFSFSGYPDPWARDHNIGSYLDQLILHKNWIEGYVTLNALPSAANTILGVMVGELMISGLAVAKKMQILALGGVAGIAAGLALSPAIPIVKKIWTPSFALYSGGFTLLALLLFFWLCEVKRWQGWAKVFVIVGANSIFIYLFHEILNRWLVQTTLVFTRWAVNLWGPWGNLLTAWAVILFHIYVCIWLYRRKIFFKL
jgi:predicted acyltransferase